MTQAEFDRIERKRGRQLVHERFAREMHLRPDWIAQMRAAQRRAALKERRDCFPRQALVGELVGLRRHAKPIARFEPDVAQLSGKRIPGRTSVGVYVDAREAFARELVGNDIACGVDCGARPMDGSGPLRVPSRRLLARVLYANRLADRFRQDSSIHRGIIGIAATIGAGADDPDGAHLLRWNIERERDAVLNEVRFLRASPAGDIAVLDLDRGAGGAHAGMRLERPFVFGLDYTGGGLEGFVHIAGFLVADLALSYRGLADVIVEGAPIREWRLGIRPFHLELLRCLDRIPLLVGDDADKALVPNNLGAGNIGDG